MAKRKKEFDLEELLIDEIAPEVEDKLKAGKVNSATGLYVRNVPMVK